MTIQRPEDPIHLITIRKHLFQVGVANNVSPLGITDTLADDGMAGCRWVGALENSASKRASKDKRHVEDGNKKER